MLQNLCDTHTHTLYSRHAYSTIRENATVACERGLELLGTTEHFSSMLFPEQHVRNFQYFINLGIWPREVDGVRLMHGCEADIVDLDGNLFGYDIVVDSDITGRALERPLCLRDYVFRGCDYVVASVHNRKFAEGATVAQATDMYLGALQHPKVFELGHTGRSAVAYDIRTVVAEAARLHKVMEINEHTFEVRGPEVADTCRSVAEACAELGCQVAVNTDAHICWAIGRMPGALAMLEEINFPQELIVTRSADAFLSALDASGVRARTEA